jgi:hypothetical protein
MGDIEDVQQLIEDYNQKPEDMIRSRLEEICPVLNSLTNQDDNTLYARLLMEKIQMTTNPSGWIDERLTELYGFLFYLDDTLELKKSFICQEINKLRDSKIYTHFLYTFPDGTDDYIQIRHEQDRQNIQDFFITAQRKLLTNNTDIMYFRTESDVTKALTPQQVSELNEMMEQWIYSFFIASWDHKENILNLTTDQELDNYDYTVGWPS